MKIPFFGIAELEISIKIHRAQPWWKRLFRKLVFMR